MRRVGFGPSYEPSGPSDPAALPSKVIPVSSNKVRQLSSKPVPPLDTPTDLSDEAVREISKAMNAILADSFALYLKTKNFHWHVSGPHFRDYHLLLDEQGTQIFGATDDMAERVRKIGGMTLRSIGDVARLQRIKDNEENYVAPIDMLKELMEDNKAVAAATGERALQMAAELTRPGECAAAVNAVLDLCGQWRAECTDTRVGGGIVEV